MIFVYDNYYHTWYEQRNNKYYDYWGNPVYSISSHLSVEMEFANWRELYCRKHFNLMETNLLNDKVWVSPHGEIFNGDADKVLPHEIVYLVYRIQVNDPISYLHNFGWLYLSVDEWSTIVNNNSTHRITIDQNYMLVEWCDVHGLEYPQGVDVIF